METIRNKEPTPYGHVYSRDPCRPPIHFTECPVDLFLMSGSDIETEAVHRMGMGKLDQMDYSNLLQTAMTFGRSRTMR